MGEFGKVLGALDNSPATMFVMGDEHDESAPAALIFTAAPDSVQDRHAHTCDRMEIVLEGSMTNEDGVVLGPGDVMLSRRGEAYGPHVAGPDGFRTVEIFSTLAGAHNVLFESENGYLEIDVATLGGLEKARQRAND
jgi:hypothetical protein